jgi:flagellum-specific peptidoglycan hydrolase FlgJ
MNYPAKRKTTAIGKDIHKAIYPDWQRSIEDYLIWQEKYYKGGDYYEFLETHGYATDLKYKEKLMKLNK